MGKRSLSYRLVGMMLLAAGPAVAQTGSSVPPVITVERSMVTRGELQQRLREIDQDLASPGYSEALREGRRAEARAIRDRLDNGDMRAGDRIRMVVQLNAAWSGEFQVSANRTIRLPSGDEISVAGLLRSELSDSLAVKLRPYFVDPKVTASASIRLQISGAVGTNGFYTAPASDLLSAVLMEKAGGPSRNANLAKSEIRRGDQVVVSGPDFQDALRQGRSLDALSVQAGDEIWVAEKPSGNVFLKAVGIIGAVGSSFFFIRSLF